MIAIRRSHTDSRFVPCRGPLSRIAWAAVLVGLMWTSTRMPAHAADDAKAKSLDAIATRLITDNSIRYNTPGLQEHITYLAGMTTRVDQKVGRDAIERYALLVKELDAIKADLDKLLGPGK